MRSGEQRVLMLALYSDSAVDREVAASTLLRVAIVSDTHGWLDERIAGTIGKCDLCVHAGDIGGHHVMESMRPRKQIVVAVRGNNDTPSKWSSQNLGYLNSLPLEASLELPGGRLVIVHGDRAGRPARRHAWLRKQYAGARAVVYGHSHHLCCDCDENPWILNPGSAGRARTFGGPSCLLLYARESNWKVLTRRFEPIGKRKQSRKH